MHSPSIIDRLLPSRNNPIKGVETPPVPHRNSSSPQLVSSVPETSHWQAPPLPLVPLHRRPIPITPPAGEALGELCAAVLLLSDLSQRAPVTHTASSKLFHYHHSSSSSGWSAPLHYPLMPWWEPTMSLLSSSVVDASPRGQSRLGACTPARVPPLLDVVHRGSSHLAVHGWWTQSMGFSIEK
jgi:hypothetical protein